MEQDELAARFEEYRDHLIGVAYRMLGSVSEAEDAVQESWLRMARADTRGVANLGGWLTTVVSRICLDLLRSRRARPEQPAGERIPDEAQDFAPDNDPEREALHADSVGRALLVVLDRLQPAERAAFVLHDLFAVPFDEIAPVVDRTTVTTKKLASRARRKIRGAPMVSGAELVRQRHLVDAFIAASRAGDVDAALAVLAPDVVRRADRAALPTGRPTEVRGAETVAEEVAVFGRNARFAEPALIDGAVGIVVAPHGRVWLAITVTVAGDRIASYQLIADPARLRRLDIGVLA